MSATNDAVAMVAVTLDGYLCRPDGAVDFLDEYEADEGDHEDFFASIGGLILGSTSYEQAVGFGWLWHETPTLVLTTRSDLPVPDGADVRFSSQPTGEAIRSFQEEIDGRLWVFGGGKVITDGLLAGAVDTLDLNVVPEAIGEGIPLFANEVPGPFKLVETNAYSNGIVRLVYRVSGAG